MAVLSRIKSLIERDPALASATAIGEKTDTAATTNTGTFSLIALIKRLLTSTDYGRNGCVIETGTTALTGLTCVGLVCISDTVIASITSSNITGDTLVGVTLPAGFTLYGNISAITLTSGSVQLIKA